MLEDLTGADLRRFATIAVPVYQTAAFTFADTAQAAKRFNLEEPGEIYSRVSNPTVAALERRVALLEGGAAAVATASGQAAVSLDLLTLLRPGDEVVAARGLYAGSYGLLRSLPERVGASARFVDFGDRVALSSAVNKRTRLLFAETIANPSLARPRRTPTAHGASAPEGLELVKQMCPGKRTGSEGGSGAVASSP